MSLFEFSKFDLAPIVICVIGALAGFFASRRNHKLEYITKERKKREKIIREINAKISTITYERKEELTALLQELKVNIDILGFVPEEDDVTKDAPIWKIIAKFENSDVPLECFEKNKHALIHHISLKFKIGQDLTDDDVSGFPHMITEIFYVFLIISLFPVLIVINRQHLLGEISRWVMLLWMHYFLLKAFVKLIKISRSTISSNKKEQRRRSVSTLIDKIANGFAFFVLIFYGAINFLFVYNELYEQIFRGSDVILDRSIWKTLNMILFSSIIGLVFVKEYRRSQKKESYKIISQTILSNDAKP